MESDIMVIVHDFCLYIRTQEFETAWILKCPYLDFL